MSKEIKTIAIIVAMDKELQLLLPLIDNLVIEQIDGVCFHVGYIRNKKVVVNQCGIGKVNAAIGAYVAIKNYNPDVMLNTGVAGAGSDNLHIMDIVIGKSIAYHDVWCGPGTKWGEAAGCPLYFDCDEVYNNVILNYKPTNIKYGLICSGDQFIASLDAVNQIRTHFPEVLAVEMESGAIAQVCYRQNVPFVCIRVISDSPAVSHDNANQYQNFWEDAPKQMFSIVKYFLSEI